MPAPTSLTSVSGALPNAPAYYARKKVAVSGIKLEQIYVRSAVWFFICCIEQLLHKNYHCSSGYSLGYISDISFKDLLLS